jgi:hypothetical protein
VSAAAGAADATASTICVPSYHPACPNNGVNLVVSDLEQALQAQGEDGVADTVLIAPGNYVENAGFEPEPGSSNPETFEPAGEDPLTVVGAGRNQTFLTSPGNSNIFVVNLASNNSRAITLRSLAIVVPASFPDSGGNGSALQMAGGDTLDGVDILSRNEGSDGIASAPGVNTVLGTEIRGDAGGHIGDAIQASHTSSRLTVADTTVIGASWALAATAGGAELVARRVDVVGARTYGAIAAGGGTITIENSRFTLDDAIGLRAGTSDANQATIFADHVSMLNAGISYPAVQLEKLGGSGGVQVLVSNSILHGFSSGYAVNAAAGPGIGIASLTARYSNLPAAGTSSGVTDLDEGNIDADPHFAADLSLPAGSPSLDAADPGAGLDFDFLNAPRPIDGDGDGVARSDQGAFEWQLPAVPDTTAPDTEITKGPGRKRKRGIARFRFRSSEPDSTFECKLDRKRVGPCASGRRYKRLKSGRHRFKVWASDAAGNRDATAAKARFRTP